MKLPPQAEDFVLQLCSWPGSDQEASPQDTVSRDRVQNSPEPRQANQQGWLAWWE